MKRVMTPKSYRLAFLGLLLLILSLPTMARDLPDFTKLVEKNGPAVVNISTIQKRKSQHRFRNMPDFPRGGPFEEWFKHFFGEEGDSAPRERQAHSLGSGFIISEDGYILTNNHVVEDADKIIVRLSDRRELDAELVGTDERSDLALLKIDADDLPVVKLGSSRDLKVGEWVLAIGSPFGFDYSATAGIVSAKKRSLPRENYVPFIQTDVAINPGNSGGPLFNLKGEVVGINSQIYSRTGGYMGVSFAIPIDVAMNVVEQIKSKGHVSRGWLGVLIQDVTRELAESFGMDKPQGALVARVLPDSPAEAAGIQVGDIILKFNGNPIDHSSDLPPMVGIAPIDKRLPVDVLRDGEHKRIQVKIGKLPDEDEVRLSRAGKNTFKSNRLNIVVGELSEQQRERLELDEGGVLVKEIKEGPALTAGVRKGDVILMLNNEKVTSVEQFKELVDELPEDKSVSLLVNRRGSPIFLALRLGED